MKITARSTGKDIKNKSLEEQKRIIQTYVQKVVVHDDSIITDTIVNFIGGGEPYRFVCTNPLYNYRHKTM